ncbi:MAG: histidinol-phosphatase [Desulfitobacteriia bacterium]|jgi:histidinol-phosphatase (PHP family)
MLDLHVHLLGHLDREASSENISLFLDEARKKEIKILGFADHDIYWENLRFDLIRNTALRYPDLEVKIGLEVDYLPGKEGQIAARLKNSSLDYVIGSVHQIGNWFFDFPTEELAHQRWEADDLYKVYFEAVEKSATSGLFDIIGHFDLIKIFKVRPREDVRVLASRALEAIKDCGLVMEINTSGRYKPIKEFYPEYKLLKRAKEMEIPFTLGSDAHEAANLGRDLAEARAILVELEVWEIVSFSNRRPEKIDLNRV